AQLVDVIPTNTTFVSFTAPAGWVNSTPAVGGTGTVTSTNSSLAAGSVPQVFTLVVRVNPNTPDGSTITNSAAVTSNTADPNNTNDLATDTTTVQNRADLSVTKTDSPDPVLAGNNLTYTITVHNNGPDDALDVSVADAVPTGTTFVSATASQGAAGESGGVVTANLGTI